MTETTSPPHRMHERADELSAYLEGDLSGSQLAAVELALESDASLRDELAAMRGLRSALRGMPDPEVPMGLSTRVMARVRDGEANPSGFRALRGFFRGPAWSSVGTAAVGFAAAAFLFGTEAGKELVGGTSETERTALALEGPFRSTPQQFIPSVDEVGVGRPGGDHRLTRVPRVPSAEALRGVTADTPAMIERSGVNAPERRATNPEVFAEAVAPVSQADSAAEAGLAPPVAVRDTLDFRSCLVANPSGEPACDATYGRWVELFEQNPRGFDEQLQQVPVPVRDVWLRQLASFAERNGRSFSVAPSNVDAAPRPRLPTSAMGFGPE